MRYLYLILLLILCNGKLNAQSINQLLTELSTSTADTTTLRLSLAIGNEYEKQLAFQKAISYYQRGLEAANRLGYKKAAAIAWDNIGDAYLDLGVQASAQNAYSEAFQLQKSGVYLKKLIYVASLSENWEQAIDYSNQAITLFQAEGDQVAEMEALNNLGLSQRKAGKVDESKETFEKVLKLYQQLPADKQQNPSLLLNAGTTASYLNDTKTAKSLFQQAYDLAKKTNDADAETSALNFLGASNYLQGDAETALEKLNEAIALAKQYQNQKELLISYELKAAIYQSLGELKEVREAQSEANDLKRSIKDEQLARRQAITTAQLEADSFEDRLQKSAISEERKNVALKQAEVDKAEKDKELAEKQKELSENQRALQEEKLKAKELEAKELEKERVIQLLELEKQRTEAEKQQQAIDLLKAEQALKELALAKQKAEQEESKKTLAILEQEKELQAQALKVETIKNNYFLAVLVLIGLILLIALYAFYTTRKTAKKLENKNKEIQEQQEQLKQVNKEVMASQEELQQNSEELLSMNERLSEEKTHTEQALESLKMAQNGLIQAEKMASLGQLTAGVAHEINNPVNYISGGTQTLQVIINDINEMLAAYRGIEEAETVEEREAAKVKLEEVKEEAGDVDELVEDANNMFDDIVTGTKRVTEIVLGLRNFARGDEGKSQQADVHELLESTLVILRNKYKGRIDVVKQYAEENPVIECYPGPLGQVFMNLINNAIDAIPQKGTITLQTETSTEYLKIQISDTGSGISEDILNNIFNPFFTTKDVGHGTGLGLAIVHGIIEKHHANIEVKSEVGKGTSFIITLPKVLPAIASS